MNEDRGLVMRVQERGPRTNDTSACQSRGKKGGPTIKSSVLGNSTGKDNHQKGIRQRESRKYIKGKLLPTHLMLCS